MERRELLQRGVLLGSLLVGEGLAGPEGAAAHGLRAFFFEGQIDGDELDGWTLWLSVTGKRAQGFAFDPATVDGELQALRLDGRLHEDRLRMDVFALKDVNCTRVGRPAAGAGAAGRTGRRGGAEGQVAGEVRGGRDSGVPEGQPGDGGRLPRHGA